MKAVLHVTFVVAVAAGLAACDRAIESAAKRSGNTKAVCRECYIHPAILDAYMDGATIGTLKARAKSLARSTAALNGEEAADVGMLERRLKKTA